jgi:hypothetical protein
MATWYQGNVKSRLIRPVNLAHGYLHTTVRHTRLVYIGQDAVSMPSDQGGQEGAESARAPLITCGSTGKADGRHSALRPVNKSYGHSPKSPDNHIPLQSQMPAANLQVTRQGHHPT